MKSRFRVVNLGNRVGVVERRHVSPEGRFDDRRWSADERTEFAAIVAEGADHRTECFDPRRLDPWRRFRLGQLIEVAVYPDRYTASKLNIWGKSPLELAFDSLGTGALDRGIPWIRFWLFPEFGRPADPPPMPAALAHQQSTQEWHARLVEQAERGQRGWDRARAVEANGFNCLPRLTLLPDGGS